MGWETRINDLRAPQLSPNLRKITQMNTPTFPHPNKARRMALERPTADSPLARRLLEAEGQEALALVKTFQSQFGAKAVWYQDGQGEVGKKPGWAE